MVKWRGPDGHDKPNDYFTYCDREKNKKYSYKLCEDWGFGQGPDKCYTELPAGKTAKGWQSCALGSSPHGKVVPDHAAAMCYGLKGPNEKPCAWGQNCYVYFDIQDTDCTFAELGPEKTYQDGNDTVTYRHCTNWKDNSADSCKKQAEHEKIAVKDWISCELGSKPGGKSKDEKEKGAELGAKIGAIGGVMGAAIGAIAGSVDGRCWKTTPENRFNCKAAYDCYLIPDPPAPEPAATDEKSTVNGDPQNSAPVAEDEPPSDSKAPAIVSEPPSEPPAEEGKVLMISLIVGGVICVILIILIIFNMIKNSRSSAARSGTSGTGVNLTP